ncbi:endolytic transglycosylase MltG [Pseudonocardia phyllosphaerae]|uniref:endolytic transglycosylase MltG n=1 Tax=Pseudonocardia phyllosphaerae TaxID=3390502 RepID=UPI0039785A26
MTARPVRVRPAPEPHRRRRVWLLCTALLAGAMLVAVAAACTGPDDFTGDGTGSVVVRVKQGDTTGAIATTLLDRGVVASRGAFLEAAAEQSGIQRVQPGYYELREQMSGSSAASAIVAPEHRVGFLDVKGGVQLDDTKAPDGTVAPGVLTQISRATCLGTGDDQPRCTSVDELRKAMAGADPAELGVPTWARAGYKAAAPQRRLEGLVAPGPYDVDPTAGPQDVLRQVVSASAERLEAAGLRGGESYKTLILASLVEKESIAKDMSKVARVISNRLAANQRLELDSTVNYPLDMQALRTTPEARAAPGPYNTYLNTGLPPTPVGSVSTGALTAAEKPAAGKWLFFVRCGTDGSSCFAETFPEHLANVEKARAAGAF